MGEGGQMVEEGRKKKRKGVECRMKKEMKRIFCDRYLFIYHIYFFSFDLSYVYEMILVFLV